MNLTKENKRNLVLLNKDKYILSQIRRDKNVVYGSQAVKKYAGAFARQPQDYDVFSPTPYKSARKLERTLDRRSRGDYYYVTPAQHENTYKVKFVGVDNKKNTKDDIHIVDFSKSPKGLKSNRLNGVKYVKPSQIIKTKRQALRDKTQKFRHAKDRRDIASLQTSRDFKRTRL